jgi:hypothetical protein
VCVCVCVCVCCAFVGLDNKLVTEFVQMQTETCREAKED